MFHYWVDISRYNYKRFAGSQYRFGRFDGPKKGQPAPDLKFLDIDGTPRSLAEFKGKFTVIETGSITCPQFVSHIAAMNTLAQRYTNMAFITIYVREAHPGSKIPPHTCTADKQDLAERLCNEENEQRTILVDTLEGETHKILGAWPNMIYIIDPSGTVVFRSLWNNPEVIANVVQCLDAGQPIDGMKTGLVPNNFSITRRVLSRAGGHAITDFIGGMGGAAIGHLSDYKALD